MATWTRSIAADEVSVVVVTSVTDAPRSTAASAMAWPCLPDERLPMKRTGSIGSRVPPAVTSTCRPCIDRGVPDVGEQLRGRADDVDRFGQPAGAHVPAGEATFGRLHDVDAPRPQEGQVVLHRRVLPHLGVHGGADHHRRPGGQQHVGQQVVGVPRRVGRQQPRGGGRHQDQVGLLAQGRVRDGVVIVPQGAAHGFGGQGAQRDLSDEAGRSLGHHRHDVRAGVDESTTHVHRLVGSDATAHTEHDTAPPSAFI